MRLPIRYEESWTRDQFIRANVDSLVAARWFFGKRPKRLRKKLAKAHLRRAYLGHMLGNVIRHRLDYTAIGRQVFSVEPLPEAATLKEGECL